MFVSFVFIIALRMNGTCLRNGMEWNGMLKIANEWETLYKNRNPNHIQHKAKKKKKKQLDGEIKSYFVWCMVYGR